MIINDIILENRALEPIELTIINQLKSQGNPAGEMFSEVGSFLSQDQFKCLLRWIQMVNNPVVVARKKKNRLTGESIITEEDYLSLEWEILTEGIFDNVFRKLFQWGVKNISRKAAIKAGGEAAKKAKKIKMPKKPKMPKVKDGDELITEPAKGSLKGQVDDIAQIEKNLNDDIAKSLNKQTGNLVDPKIVKSLSKDTAKQFLYKSGLTKKTLKNLKPERSLLTKAIMLPFKIKSMIVDTLMNPIRLLGLAAVDAGHGEKLVGVAQALGMIDAGEKARKMRQKANKTTTDCDNNARKIREILRSHGWLMSATSTGY